MNKKLSGTSSVKVRKVLLARIKKIASNDWGTVQGLVHKIIVYGLKHIDEVKREI
jgi:hypothetical protein